MKGRRALPILVVVLLLLRASTASAQTDTPQNPPQQVLGKIVNRTTQGQVPEGLTIMLHAWEQAGADLGMLHGVSGPDGEVSFPDVEVEPGAYYAVMVVYNEGSYLSEQVVAQEGQELPPFEIGIFESTSELSAVTVDSQHVFFSLSQGGLAVAEVYSLSNSGDQTVAKSVAVDGGGEGTLAFPLPDGAANVSFPGASEDRFLLAAPGFVDTMPLVPGEGTGRVVVTYVLPYQDEMMFERQSAYAVGVLAFLIPHAGSLTLTAEGTTYEGPQRMGENEVFDAYSVQDIRKGSSVKVLLSGAPPDAATGMVANVETEPREGIALGLGMLGLAMVVAGVWWWRRGRDEPEIEEAIEGAEPEWTG